MKGIMKTYYIVFETEKTKHWRIRETENDLDTSCGLQKEIEELENELSGSVFFDTNKKQDIIIYFWKELKATEPGAPLDLPGKATASK